MKRLATLTIALLLTSCWKTGEDWSLCPTDGGNLELRIGLPEVAKADAGRRVSVLDVYLFDGAHRFVEKRRIAAPEADGLWRAGFSVAPGTYHAVCWGNADTRSQLSCGENIDDSCIDIDNEETGAQIYYAPQSTPSMRSPDRAADYSPLSVDVPSGRRVVHDMTLGKVHRTVEVFITGLTCSAPTIEYTGARGNLDFLLRSNGKPRTLRQLALQRTIDTRAGTTSAMCATFHSALTPIQGDGWIRVLHPDTGGQLASVRIADHIANNGIADDSYIPIHFAFTLDAKVSVTVPEWMNNEITPDF